MLERAREAIAKWLAPKPAGYLRSYAGSKGGRLTTGWISSDSSADTELRGGLKQLRNRSRSLVRDFSYAKRAKIIVVNNVIGAGIGMQAQVTNARGNLEERINSDIERAWEDWCNSKACHTGGTLHFSDIERLIMGQVFEAGEAFLRKHPSKFGNSSIPFALELIESEKLADEFTPPFPQGQTGEVRLGVEVDTFQRPIAYWIRSRHPGDYRGVSIANDQLIRIPANQIIHAYVVDRWPQSRGEPWLHTSMRRLHDMNGYSESEIVAARAAASYMAFIKTDPSAQIADTQDPGPLQMQFEPGMIERMYPGDDIVINNPNRPNPNMDPFMRLMIREVASGIPGVSYESLSKDYSQSNFSSSRMALLDDRDSWRVLQSWYIRTVRQEIHREWLDMAVLSGAIPSISLDAYTANPQKFQAVRFKPRGWSWIDPTKEVQAYKDAVRCGFTTVSDVIAATAGGADIEDVLRQRARELEMMEALDLDFDTDVEEPEELMQEAAPTDEPSDNGEDSEDSARVLKIRKTA